MGMPVKLSDELVLTARREAGLADRSITGQIEHWAKLGRAVESALKYPEMAALKRSGGDLEGAFAGDLKCASVRQTLESIAASSDRTSALKKIQANSKPMYGSDPAFPGRIVRVNPDGTRTPGKFENRRFVPAAALPVSAAQ